jgi:type IV pilus assembly protein PilE
MKRHAIGVTLIELMITVTVVAILAAVAYPSYIGYARRANRTDATAALLRVAAAEEKFYVQNNQYTGTVGTGGLSISGTERGYYTLLVPTADAVSFTATATAVTGQLADTDCRTLQITSTGVKSAKKSDGSDNSTACWR